MKKILTALLLAAILTSLCACAGMPVEPTTESTAAAPSGTTEAEGDRLHRAGDHDRRDDRGAQGGPEPDLQRRPALSRRVRHALGAGDR